MSERKLISLGGRETWAHIVPLSPSECIALAPATHGGACRMVSDVQPGMRFAYADETYEVVKAWDEAARNVPAGADQHAKTSPIPAIDKMEVAYHQSRIGKFLSLLLIKVES